MTTHVTEKLNDYADGLLSSAEQNAIDKHLRDCAGCRRELEGIKRLLDRSSELPKTIRPQRDLWQGIEQRIKEQQSKTPILSLDAGGAKPASRFGTARWLRTGLAAAAVLAAAFIGYWWYGQISGPSWNVAVVEGAARIGADFFSGEGRFRVGELLETGRAARVRIQVGSIGQVEVGPNTRLRLLRASLTDHRLALDEGTIRAAILAPPRLFFVQTPSALAVDLGCVYTLQVDSTGSSILHVTSGWVALEFNGRESVVPAGAKCVTRPGFGPGTPFQVDASEQLVRALSRHDFENASDALAVVLRESRNMDSITLWHLFFRTGGSERALVYDRLANLVPPPADVTRDGMLDGDPEMIKRWQTHLNLGQTPWWKVWN